MRLTRKYRRALKVLQEEYKREILENGGKLL